MIYFIGNKQEKLVKIGYTGAKIEARIHSLQCNCPFEVEALLLINGMKDTEKYFHDLFKKDHVRGEWYRISDNVQSYLDSPVSPQIEESFKNTPRRDSIKKTNSQIEKLYKTGKSIPQVAKETGYTASQVKTFIYRRKLHIKYDRQCKAKSGYYRTPKKLIVPEITVFSD